MRAHALRVKILELPLPCRIGIRVCFTPQLSLKYAFEFCVLIRVTL